MSTPHASPNMLLELDRRARRRLALHAVAAVVATALVVASAMAVRYELSGAPLDGGIGLIVRVFELVFIVGIVPLTVTAAYSSGVTIALLARRNAQRRRLPAAAVRR